MSVVGAALVSGALGLLGGERRNRIDQREAQKQRDFTAGEAAINRAFQQEMRNTAWQAGVADMRAAGLNPALAYSQGPASSPGGSMGGGANTAPALDTVSSAFQAAQQRKTLSLLDKQIEQTAALEKKTDAEAQSALEKERLDRYRSNYLLSKTEGQRLPMIDLLESEIAQARYGAMNTKAMADRNNVLTRIGAPLAELSDKAGTLLPILGLLGGGAGAASQVLRGIGGFRKRSTTINKYFLRRK